ncbi:MAG: GPR endopeptidase [Clostridia bacterium]
MKESMNFRTDMADERVDTYKKVNNLTEVDGIQVVTKNDECVLTTTVNVLNENGSKAVLKDIGKYVTMQIQDLNYLDTSCIDDISKKVALEIEELIGKNKENSILIVGLGNVYVTPDALGPKVVENVEVTRHILNFAKDIVTPNTRSVSAVSPGVLGSTGIETSEIVNAIVKNTKPSMIIVIDSLASQSVERIGNTIQFSNTGITPGSGVKNKREGLNAKTLGIPVIAIGVPTVVDMATITNDAINKIVDSKTKDILNQSIENRYEMIANALDTENYIVTPKEIDNVISNVAKIISDGLNIALQS